MKEQQAAVVVLILVICALAYGTQQMRNKMVDMRNQAETAKIEANNAEAQRLGAETSLRVLKEETDELRSFYRAWLPHFEAVKNEQAGEALVIEAVKDGGVFSTSQSFEDKEGQPDSVVPRSVKAELVFEDEYAKALNWMGQIERRLPTARTSEFVVRRGDSGNDVHISLVLEVPIFDPSALVVEAPVATDAEVEE